MSTDELQKFLAARLERESKEREALKEIGQSLALGRDVEQNRLMEDLLVRTSNNNGKTDFDDDQPQEDGNQWGDDDEEVNSGVAGVAAPSLSEAVSKIVARKSGGASRMDEPEIPNELASALARVLAGCREPGTVTVDDVAAAERDLAGVTGAGSKVTALSGTTKKGTEG
jgi:hypothetical protein